jgi:transaldolase
MQSEKLKQLRQVGQSIWLDYISRSLIDTGTLGQMIKSGIRGLTSNPTIFSKAISQGRGYDERIKDLCQQGKSAFEIYDELTTKDIQDAADMFRPVYEQTYGLDGYVSLEVNPQLAFNTKQTIEEARRLFQKVGRANLMLKLPANEAGFEAAEQLLSEGINVNVTLIFSLQQYIKTTRAFLSGLKKLSQQTQDISGVASVASVFVSRLDTAVDNLLTQMIEKEKEAETKARLGSLMGKAALANAHLIYSRYTEVFFGGDFKELSCKGARPQRLLWASTSTKNPAYSDIKYVCQLIAPDTINTVPQDTFKAFLDHGLVKEALTSDIRDAQKVISDLKGVGIDIDQVCAQLFREGLSAFENAFSRLLNSIDTRMLTLCRT